MSEATLQLAVIGLGNLGLWTVWAIALAILQSPARLRWKVLVVDYDTVDDRAVRKGYPPHLLGSPKRQPSSRPCAPTSGPPSPMRCTP